MATIKTSYKVVKYHYDANCVCFCVEVNGRLIKPQYIGAIVAAGLDDDHKAKQIAERNHRPDNGGHRIPISHYVADVVYIGNGIYCRMTTNFTGHPGYCKPLYMRPCEWLAIETYAYHYNYQSRPEMI